MTYQKLRPAEGGELDGGEARGAGGGGHRLDAPEEDLHVLLASHLALVEEGPGPSHAHSPVSKLPVRLVTLELLCKDYPCFRRTFD